MFQNELNYSVGSIAGKGAVTLGLTGIGGVLTAVAIGCGQNGDVTGAVMAGAAAAGAFTGAILEGRSMASSIKMRRAMKELGGESVVNEFFKGFSEGFSQGFQGQGV